MVNHGSTPGPDNLKTTPGAHGQDLDRTEKWREKGLWGAQAPWGRRLLSHSHAHTRALEHMNTLIT